MGLNLEPLEKEKFAYLTTTGRRTGKAHTVELWFALTERKIYLSHEGDETDWMRNIRRNSRVQLKIGKVNLEADASLVMGGIGLEVGRKSLYEKYYGPAPKATIDDWFELSIIIELTPVETGP